MDGWNAVRACAPHAQGCPRQPLRSWPSYGVREGLPPNLCPNSVSGLCYCGKCRGSARLYYRDYAASASFSLSFCFIPVVVSAYSSSFAALPPALFRRASSVIFDAFIHLSFKSVITFFMPFSNPSLNYGFVSRYYLLRPVLFFCYTL